jgi:F420-dependent oxidoreductase-like protein
MATDIRFGIHSGQQYSDFPGYVDLWQEAERLGFDWASVFDHFLPIQADPDGPCFEGMTLLAAMAAHTQRLRLGMLVVGVTYRNPALLAKMAATIDHVSGGRLELGLGAAWYELEHGQYGFEFPAIGTRMDMLDEGMQVVRALLVDETANFEGRHYRLRDARCEPKPIQERLPLWVGGSGEKRTLRVVAEHADGWNTFLFPEDAYRHKLDVLARHCADVGRDPGTIRKQAVFRALLGEDEAEVAERVRERTAELGISEQELREQEVAFSRMIIGTPEQCAERLRPYVALGISDFILFARPPGDRRTMELVAKAVAPAVRSAAGGSS